MSSTGRVDVINLNLDGWNLLGQFYFEVHGCILDKLDIMLLPELKFLMEVFLAQNKSVSCESHRLHQFVSLPEVFLGVDPQDVLTKLLGIGLIVLQFEALL